MSGPPSEQHVRRVVERNIEVVEAIEARKGPAYARRVEMYVACMKLHLVAIGPDPKANFDFAKNLLLAFGVHTDATIKEFIADATSVQKAQEI